MSMFEDMGMFFMKMNVVTMFNTRNQWLSSKTKRNGNIDL